MASSAVRTAKTFLCISQPFRAAASAACRKARVYSSMSRKVPKDFRQRTFGLSKAKDTGCSSLEEVGTLLCGFGCQSIRDLISHSDAFTAGSIEGAKSVSGCFQQCLPLPLNFRK